MNSETGEAHNMCNSAFTSGQNYGAICVQRTEEFLAISISSTAEEVISISNERKVNTHIL